MKLRIPAHEYKHAPHQNTSAGRSTVSASLQSFQANRSRGLRPIAMESAALAFAKQRRVLRFQSITSPHHRFWNPGNSSARGRNGFDVALVSTSAEATLRKGHDRGGPGNEVGKGSKVSNS